MKCPVATEEIRRRFDGFRADFWTQFLRVLARFNAKSVLSVRNFARFRGVRSALIGSLGALHEVGFFTFPVGCAFLECAR